MDKAILAEGVWKSYSLRKGFLKKERLWVLKNVSFEVKRGEGIGVLGESGSGKTTLGKLVLGLEKPDRGVIQVSGNFQPVFQDPYASLNPKMKIKDVLLEPLVIRKFSKKEGIKRIKKIFERFYLSEELLEKKSPQLSGGERQRIAIARSLLVEPDGLVLDEPTSSLDLITENQILLLLRELKKEYNLTFFLISHSFKVCKNLVEKFLILYRGEVMEIFPIEKLSNSHHPYTRALLEPETHFSLFEEDTKEEKDFGGCTFYRRCKGKKEICYKEKPPLKEVGKSHYIACFLF